MTAMTDRLGIGGNNPPLSALEAMTVAAGDLLELVSVNTAVSITDEAQADALDALLDDVRRSKGAAVAAKEEVYRPLKAAADQVSVDWKPVFDKHDAAAKAIKEALTPWRVAQQAIADKLAQDARDAAAKLQEAAQATLRGDSDLEARFDAEDALKQAGKLTAKANRLDRGASGLRSKQYADVVNAGELLKHIKLHDANTLRSWLSDYAQKALPSVLPGVNVRTERTAV